MPTQDANTTATAMQSEGENVPEVELAAAKVAALEPWARSWSEWAVWLTAGTAILALLYFVASRKALVNFAALDKARDELSAAKERQFAKELKDKDDVLQEQLKAKDVLIAQANARAEEAKGLASNADKGTVKALEETAKANERAAALTKEAELERLARTKLEAQIAPRRLTNDQGNAIVAALRRFNGKTVRVVSYALDLEAGVLAKQILLVLKAAGINGQDAVSSQMPMGGFLVAVHVDTTSEAEREFVNALRKELSTSGGLIVDPRDARGAGPVMGMGVGPARGEGVPAVTITVGVKP